MIYPVTMYAAKCDNCGVGLLDGTECAAMCNEGIRVGLIEDGWHTYGNKHYCPDCFSWGDDDEIVLRAPSSAENAASENKP